MKKQFYIIGGLTALAVIILITLNATMEKPNKHNNGFNREFSKVKISEISRIQLDFIPREICGIRGDSIYVSSNLPGKIFLFSKMLQVIDTMNLKINAIAKFSNSFFTIVHYPNVYLIGGNTRSVIRANLMTHAIDSFSFNTSGFGNAIIISPSSLIIRAVDTLNKNSVFTKINLPSKQILQESNISKKMRDAGFTYDGKLSYDPKSQRLLFVSYYCNQITCFDTSLLLLYRSKTIDTISEPTIKISRNRAGMTLSKAPIVVNSISTVFDGVLYVKSKMKADNEEQQINNKTIIDKYMVSNGRYLESFYLPVSPKQVSQLYFASRDSLYVLNDRWLRSFIIN